MKRAIGVVLQVTLLVGLTTVVIGAVPASAVPLNGCTPTANLGPNDDGSSSAVDIGFPIDFFGTDSTQLFVNNNGNVTFANPLGDFTPAPIGTGLGFAIIAPFWADVDTRGAGSAVTTYGTTTFDGHAAFCVDWAGVGYYAGHTDKLNSFQLLLVDRSDQAAGDFDIVFNYQSIQWETGDLSGGSGGLGGSSARAGYSDGQSGGTSHELPGSGVNGGLLDSNSSTGLAFQTNDGTPGQDLFPVRNGVPVAGSISGSVVNDLNGNGQADGGEGAPDIPGGVTICLKCGTEDEVTTTTDANGDYSFSGLTPGTYSVTFTVPDGWHNTGAITSYDIALGSGDVSSGNDFFIQQDEQSNPNLTLTKTGPVDPVQELNPITYTLDVGNNGSSDANDVVVTDNLPSGTTFDSASTTQGTCGHTATTVTCNIGTVAADGSATVTITIQAPSEASDTTITNNASASASNADTVNASTDTQVTHNNGGSTTGQVPPNSTVPLTFTTATQSVHGNPGVNAGDPTAVSLLVPPGGPGGTVQLDEIPCTVAPCDGPAATTNASTSATTSVVLGGVVFNVVPPTGYSNTKPFRATLFYDKTLHAKPGPVFYFKPGVSTHEIKLRHCGSMPPNGGKPCVLFNAKVTTGPGLIRGDWKVVVRLSSDPHMHR